MFDIYKCSDVLDKEAAALSQKTLNNTAHLIAIYITNNMTSLLSEVGYYIVQLVIHVHEDNP